MGVSTSSIRELSKAKATFGKRRVTIGITRAKRKAALRQRGKIDQRLRRAAAVIRRGVACAARASPMAACAFLEADDRARLLLRRNPPNALARSTSCTCVDALYSAG